MDEHDVFIPETIASTMATFVRNTGSSHSCLVSLVAGAGGPVLPHPVCLCCCDCLTFLGRLVPLPFSFWFACHPLHCLRLAYLCLALRRISDWAPVLADPYWIWSLVFDLGPVRKANHRVWPLGWVFGSHPEYLSFEAPEFWIDLFPSLQCLGLYPFRVHPYQMASLQKTCLEAFLIAGGTVSRNDQT